VYPARASDRRCTDTTNALPMGARIWLNMTESEVNALNVPAWKRTILHALRRFGMIFGDTGSSFLWSWQTEAGSMYSTFGFADKWLDYGKAQGWSFYSPDGAYVASWDMTADGIDWKNQIWSRLKVLDPCISQGTCQ
jgi:hypothetical protein